MIVPTIGDVLRLRVAMIGGYLAVHAGFGLDGLFAMVGAGMLVVGIVTAGGIRPLSWRAHR